MDTCLGGIGVRNTVRWAWGDAAAGSGRGRRAVLETSTRAHVFASTLPDRSICGSLKRIPGWSWDPRPAPPGIEACTKLLESGRNFRRDSTRWNRRCGRTVKPCRDGTAPKHYLTTRNVCVGFGLPVLDSGPGGPPPGPVRMVSDTVLLTQAREVRRADRYRNYRALVADAVRAGDRRLRRPDRHGRRPRPVLR
jgi:hypothetical protein